MKTCQWIPDKCDNPCEGRTDYCPRHNRALRKFDSDQKKMTEQREKAFSKKREPRATISKDPKKWRNSFLCSSGKRITQDEINRCRDHAYNLQAQSKDMTICEGCGQPATCRAHIIAQARCKQIGKTELIWNFGNFFPSCYGCNLAIENPKGEAWKQLKNIEECIEFIKLHDQELYTKFMIGIVTTNSYSGTFKFRD